MSTEIIDETVKLELNAAEVYRLFREIFPEDREFWNELHEEEKNHAELLQSIREVIGEDDSFPEEFLSAALDDLKSINSRIAWLLTKYATAEPGRSEAFNTALDLEESAGEIHFQAFMEKDEDNEIVRTYQKLNNDDKDHMARIRDYMRRQGIERIRS